MSFAINLFQFKDIRPGRIRKATVPIFRKQGLFQLGYIVKDDDQQTRVVTRRGPFATENEARMVLVNTIDAYEGQAV